MTTRNILIVAFDGFDEKLIHKYNLREVLMEEHGSIDNSSNVKSVFTSELYTSFITGETYEKHGVKGLQKSTKPIKEKTLSHLGNTFLANLRGVTRLIRTLRTLFDIKKEKYTKEDYTLPTLFEKFPDSVPLFVPGYNPSWFWRINADVEPLKHGASVDETAEFIEREFNHRKRTLWDVLDEPPHSFVMCHFHKPDTYQHLFNGQKESYDKERLKDMYKEMDKLAGKIKEKAEKAGYDTIIFMSDHGLPTEHEHNENAFYSCNHELFPNKTPHITDFHDKILELTDMEQEETVDIDI